VVRVQRLKGAHEARQVVELAGMWLVGQHIAVQRRVIGIVVDDRAHHVLPMRALGQLAVDARVPYDRLDAHLMGQIQRLASRLGSLGGDLSHGKAPLCHLLIVFYFRGWGRPEGDGKQRVSEWWHRFFLPCQRI